VLPPVLGYVIGFALLAVLVLLLYVLWKVRAVHLKVYDVMDAVRQTQDRDLVNHFQQSQLVRILEHELDLDRPLPALRGWAASPDFLLVITRHARDRRPKIVVECSSGVSTIVLARVAQLNGQGHVYSLEHDPVFGAQTRQELHARGLAEWATVIDAPLTEHRIDGDAWPWYSLENLPVDEIDQIVIDGPPYSVGPLARYPAGPLLFGKVREDGAAFLDDADRVEETEISERWVRELSGWKMNTEYCEKGCRRFTRRGD
tara:strand:- start:1022 stop:1798 length:777 start_codon:yes stop_codon:yes gene_type:complete